MKFIELSFRNESVFMVKRDITGLVNEEWFLKTILETNYSTVNTNNTKENNADVKEVITKIVINEDKNTSMSLIDSMRYNRLIVYPNVSMDYLLLLSEKWCIPENIIEMIRERMVNNINVNNLNNFNYDNPVISLRDNMIFKCIGCNAGFKMADNKMDSCLRHLSFNLHSNKFICCGGEYGSTPCILGYHVLSTCDRVIYSNYND